MIDPVQEQLTGRRDMFARQKRKKHTVRRETKRE